MITLTIYLIHDIYQDFYLLRDFYLLQFLDIYL